jgi:DNA-binding CsgD family transcriptional regulator
VVRAACAFEFTTLLLWNLDEPARAIALARETADASAPLLGEARARGALGSLVLYSGRPAEALEVLGPFLADPTTHDEPLVDHVVSVARTLTGECAEGATDALRGLARCLDASNGAPDADPEIHVVSSTLALGEAGRLAEAEALAREWYERALQRGIHVGWVALSCARVALHRGDVRAADRFAREAAADFADLDNLAPRRWAMAAQLLAAAASGRSEECIRLDRSLDELGPSAVRFLEPDIERARAWGVSASGHLSEARRELCATALRAEQSGAPALAATAWHDAVRLGARDAAPELVRLGEVVDSEWTRVRAAHADAFVRDDATALLAAAHDFAAMGASLCAADASAQAVIVLRRKGRRHDTRAAMARCNEYRSACGPVATPSLRELGAVQLSPREREIARLAASGFTSREVAARLSISVRTVDNLLQRAYTKLGVRRRDELVAALEHV